MKYFHAGDPGTELVLKIDHVIHEIDRNDSSDDSSPAWFISHKNQFDKIRENFGLEKQQRLKQCIGMSHRLCDSSLMTSSFRNFGHWTNFNRIFCFCRG